MQSFFLAAVSKNLKNINISVGQTFEITIFAMTVVFSVLIFLMFVIVIQTKILNLGKKKKPEVIAQTKDSLEEKVEESYVNDEEIVAAIMGALSANIGVPVNKLNVKSIRRINNNSNWRNSVMSSNTDLR